MSFPDFVKFALICFDALAWPLFSLVYPLRASIQAIEANSNSDTKKLVTYWVIFSLISLFEHAFMGMLQWLPFWPYMKLTIVCWMMIPHFDGAFYAYNHFVHPVLYIDVKTIINWFKKQQEFVLKDNFLAEADKYIKAHGPEALEKLIASKKDIKPVQVTEKREVASVNPIPETEPNAAQTVDNMITLPDIRGAAGCYPPEIPSDKQVQKEWTCAMCQVITTCEKTLNIHLQGRRHRKACEELMKAKNQPSKGEVSFASVDSVKHFDLPHKEPQKHASEPNAAQIVDDMITLLDIEGAAGCYLPEIPSDKQVQKEWTCAMCQVTIESEKTLNIHLQGRRHRKACEELMKAKNQPSKGEVSFVSVDSVKHSDLPHKEPQKHASQPNAAQTVDNMITLPDIDGAAGCYLPEIPSDKQVQKQWTCAMCQVTTESEKTLNIHLQGRRHRKACEELMKAKNQPSKGEVSFASVDSVKHSDLPHKEPQKHASEPNAAQTVDDMITLPDIEGVAGCYLPEIPSDKQVQKEWTCAMCQVTTEGEKTLNIHLQGRRHRKACEELMKAKNQPSKGEVSFASVDSVKHSDLPRKEPQKHASEPNAAQTVDNMITLLDIEGAAGCYLPEIPSDKQVQKQWTCAMCQVTTESEKTLNIHLQGRRHRKACEELMKAKNQPSKGEVSFASVDNVKHSDLPHKEPQKHASQPNAAQTVDNMITLSDIKGAAGCYPPEISSDKQVQKEWTCAMCQVTTTSEKTLNIHLQGRRHRKACEELMKAKNQPSKGEVSFASVDSVKHSDLPHKEPQKHASEPNAAQTVDDMITLPDIEGVAGCYLPEIPSDKQVQKEWTCAMCQVTTESEKTLNIHLQGRRHRKACEELMKAKNQPSKGEVSFASVDSVKHSDLPHKEPQKHASEPNAAETVDHMITLPDIKGAGGCYPPEISSDKQVQKEWTCVMCQVTTTSEKTLNIHLEGRQHMKACEELMKAKNQPSKGEVSFASVDSVKHSNLPHKEPQKHASSTSTQASQKEQQPSVAKNYDLPSNNTSTSSKAVNPKTGTSNPNLPNEEPEKLPNDMARSQTKTQ